MQPSEYQEWARRFDNHDPMFQELAAALGLMAEAGEVSNEYERAMRSTSRSLRKDKLKLELGDVLWNVARLATINGWTLEELMAANVEKLSVRYSTEGIPISE